MLHLVRSTLYVALIGVVSSVTATSAGGQTKTIKVPGIDKPLHFINAPVDYKVTENGVVITAPGKTDKYIAAPGGYSPDNAPLLVFDNNDENFILSTKVSHPFAGKWDSGGIVVEADSKHWFKFEFEGDYTGAHRVVSVVTNESSDDVNSMQFDSNSYHFRVAKTGDVYYLYVANDGKSWYLVRTFKFRSAGPLKVGLIAQCPQGNAASITFSDVSYSPTKIKDMWKGE